MNKFNASFFKSEAHYYGYLILEKNKDSRHSLGITKLHYNPKMPEVADKWYEQMKEKVEPISEAGLKARVLYQLDIMYKRMKWHLYEKDVNKYGLSSI